MYRDRPAKSAPFTRCARQSRAGSWGSFGACLPAGSSRWNFPAEIDGAIAGLDAALPAAERSREVAEQALAAVAARAEAGAVPQVDVETTRAVLRRTQMRARMLRLGLDGLRARRAILTTSLPSR